MWLGPWENGLVPQENWLMPSDAPAQDIAIGILHESIQEDVDQWCESLLPVVLLHESSCPTAHLRNVLNFEVLEGGEDLFRRIQRDK